MTDLIGFELSEAESRLKESGTEYTVKYTYPLRPLEGTDSVRVIRQRLDGGRVELVVGLFRTKI